MNVKGASSLHRQEVKVFTPNIDFDRGGHREQGLSC